MIMFKNAFLFCVAIAMILAGAVSGEDRGVLATSKSPHVKIRNLDLADVRWTGGFWGRWFEVNQSGVIPTVWEALQSPENGAQYASFLRSISTEKSFVPLKGLNTWSDGDVYKYVEALAAIYATTRHPALITKTDEMIGVFANAQEPDGYISTPVRLRGAKRWQRLGDHELYNMGHLMTAASIHHRATGKDNFLRIATRVADYLYTVFQPRPRELAHFCFNPSNIMGTLELYRTTRNPKYLELAGIFVDMRGSAPGGTDMHQSRIPLRKEKEAVGHAVAANYLYAGATDVYAETGEQALLEALKRIWSDMASKKVYVTGAVGNLYDGRSRFNDLVHEAFGVEYELPNRLGYNETCANIANAMWNLRMLGVTGDARHADLMELVLYNSLLSAVNVDGKGFYYNNPLRRDGEDLALVMRKDPALRAKVLSCYCCPTNIARTLAELHGWAYGKSNDALWVHLYGSNVLETRIAGGSLKLQQTTDYPWQGVVRFQMERTPGSEFALHLRIPAWAEGAELVTGKQAPRKVQAGAYAEVRRKWAPGDTIELRLPLEPRLVVANPYVESARNQVTVMRGPIVYALESTDLPPGTKIWDVVLPAGIRFRAHHDPNLLGGVTVLDGRARISSDGEWSAMLYKTFRTAPQRTADIRLIPYYAWANRGVSHMMVWLPISR